MLRRLPAADSPPVERHCRTTRRRGGASGRTSILAGISPRCLFVANFQPAPRAAESTRRTPPDRSCRPPSDLRRQVSSEPWRRRCASPRACRTAGARSSLATGPRVRERGRCRLYRRDSTATRPSLPTLRRCARMWLFLSLPETHRVGRRSRRTAPSACSAYFPSRLGMWRLTESFEQLSSAFLRHARDEVSGGHRPGRRLTRLQFVEHAPQLIDVGFAIPGSKADAVPWENLLIRRPDPIPSERQRRRIVHRVFDHELHV